MNQVISVFKDINKPQPVYISEMQDQIREHMMDRLGKRPPNHAEALVWGGKRGGQALAEKHAKRRAELAPEVMDLRSKGVIVSDIARKVGISPTTVNRIFKENDMSMVRATKIATTAWQEQAEERRKAHTPQVERLHKMGYPPVRIAAQIGMSRSFVRSVLKQCSIKDTSRITQLAERRKSMWPDVQRLRAEGKAPSTIATFLGCHEQTVIKIIKENAQ